MSEAKYQVQTFEDKVNFKKPEQAWLFEILEAAWCCDFGDFDSVINAAAPK